MELKHIRQLEVAQEYIKRGMFATGYKILQDTIVEIKKSTYNVPYLPKDGNNGSLHRISRTKHTAGAYS